MPRDLVLSNGSLLVSFDGQYNVRDLFFPHVGEENHTVGDVCRTGLWVDGRFFWIDDPAWQRTLHYAPSTLVTEVTAHNPEVGITLNFSDGVDFDRNLFLRQVRITNEGTEERRARLFFHYDFHLYGVDIGHTVYYEPTAQAVVAFKNKRYFLLSGQTDNHLGIDSWTTGLVGDGREGTWRDAEDGELQRNPIADGHVDATIALHPNPIPPGGQSTVYHWLAAATSLDEVKELDELVRGRGPRRFLVRTADYWQAWVTKEELSFGDLPPPVAELYQRSLLIMRAQVDSEGPIIAATDWDTAKYLRDTYAYMWPRDGAITALAFDMAGFAEVPQRFFEFCGHAITMDGYLWQKYTPSGDMASSWHSRIGSGGEPQLPIQEDETALVVYGLWEHYRRHRDIEFIKPLYRPLIKNAADFMAQFREPVTRLPSPSFDLWEERYGIHTFTVAAVWAGLQAAARFTDLFREQGLGRSYRQAADEIRAATIDHLYDAETGRFVRTLYPQPGGKMGRDLTLDSSLCGLFLFGMFPPTDPRVEGMMGALRERLWCKTWVGGMARYEHDVYNQRGADWDNVPGNPWFICTIWLGRYYIARAQRLEDLDLAREILSWVAERALSSGVLAEQVHPYNNSPLSVSPLTWSHAELVIAVREYLAKRAELLQGPKSALVGMVP